MISPANLLKRVSVGGRLLPFFKCACLYLVAWSDSESGGGAAPSLGAVLAKCAPVLCLLLVLVIHVSSLPYDKGGYSRLVCLGLSLSALGDALLLWPQYFVGGMAAFGLAHVAYISAFGWKPRALLSAAALYAATGLYLAQIKPPDALRILVPLYSMLLATMAWRGVARGGRAAAGALMFLVSDAILGYSLFGGPVQYRLLLVMSTYYLGQLGIALSALETDRLPSNT